MWMSHGDHVEAPPPGYVKSPRRAATPSPAFRHATKPDLRDAVPLRGRAHRRAAPRSSANFLFGVCKATPDWTPGSFVEREIAKIRAAGRRRHVICGLSGGVDSSVAAALVHRAIGDQLTCIFVDTGLLRLHEREQVERTFKATPRHQARHGRRAEERFLRRSPAWRSRSRSGTIIGHTFIDVFEDAAAAAGKDAAFLVQGTLYPDVIESMSAKGGPSATIKTHHNVGGLKPGMKFTLIEPLRELFKDEVRNVGRELGLPEEMVGRHPFPGPGLAIRVLGAVDQRRSTRCARRMRSTSEEIRDARVSTTTSGRRSRCSFRSAPWE